MAELRQQNTRGSGNIRGGASIPGCTNPNALNFWLKGSKFKESAISCVKVWLVSTPSPYVQESPKDHNLFITALKFSVL